MVQCPDCGVFDSMGLGFCTACGKGFPKHLLIDAQIDADSLNRFEERERSDSELESSVFSGLAFLVFMAFFILMFLLMNDADPLMILIAESFPLLWILLLLLQWRSTKGKSGN